MEFHVEGPYQPVRLLVAGGRQSARELEGVAIGHGGHAKHAVVPGRAAREQRGPRGCARWRRGVGSRESDALCGKRIEGGRVQRRGHG